MSINMQAEMESHGIALDVRSYTALIGAAALAGDLIGARQLFDSMAGESATASSMCNAASTCASNGTYPASVMHMRSDTAHSHVQLLSCAVQALASRPTCGLSTR